MQTVKGKIFLGAAFLLAGMILLSVAQEPHEMLFMEPNQMDVMTYPKYLLYGWIVASLLYIFLPSESVDWSGLKTSWPGLFRVVCAIAAYIVLFQYLGLAVSTFLFLLIFFWVMNYREPKKMFFIAFLGSAITWAVFEYLLEVSMPQPLWMELFR